MKAQPKSLTIAEVLTLRKQQMLIVNPEYQRGAIWSESQKRKLLDSVLRGYPIPLIYLHHICHEAAGLRSERFEIIDGQQRLNAIYDFSEGAFSLFDPIKDEAQARFPEFIKNLPCPWSGCTFGELSPELQRHFLEIPLSVVEIETHDPHEARDLFVRLQAGMPLNSQEKRDAWPGDFTDFILRIGGKPDIARYVGHEFFTKLMGAGKSKDRGKFRQVAAQVAMLYLKRRRSNGEVFTDINSRAIDDFYYENLDFDGNSVDAKRLTSILDRLVALLGDGKRKKILAHDAIHLVLLLDTLWDDYAPSWQDRLAVAFDKFREDLAMANKLRNDPAPPDHWLRYGVHTRANSDRAGTIQQRHEFFSTQMHGLLLPVLKDERRAFGPLEREILYYAMKKRCQVCDGVVAWGDAEIHHVHGHAQGGRTSLENGALVHGVCHPKGKAAEDFARTWPRRA